MTGRLRRWVVAGAALAALAACSSTPEPPRVAGAEPVTEPVVATAPCPTLERVRPVADGLPPLRLPCLGDGPVVRLSDLRGVPTVVNVWAAWCTTCDREMPLFAEAMRRYGGQVRFFGIHYKASREAGLASEADFGVPFPSVHDEDGDLVVRELGAYAPPQTYFVTADGRLAGRKVGEIESIEELAGLLEQHLGVRR